MYLKYSAGCTSFVKGIHKEYNPWGGFIKCSMDTCLFYRWSEIGTDIVIIYEE